MCQVVIFSILFYETKDPSLYPFDMKAERRNSIGLLELAVGHLACRAEHGHLRRPLKSVAYLLFFSVDIKILVLVLLS